MKSASQKETGTVHYGLEIVIGPDYYKVQIVIPAAKEKIGQEVREVLQKGKRASELKQEHEHSR